MFRNQVKWSPLETAYLKEHRKDDINQLTIILAKSRNAIKRKLDEFDGKTVTKKQNRKSIIGKRPDLGIFLRSAWEANVCRWLNSKKENWKYEPKVFSFTDHGVKHGTTSYCPDIQLTNNWLEIKGFLEPKAKVALRRFKKFYPDEFKKLVAIVGRRNTAADKFFNSLNVPILAYYNELEKEFKNKIPNWE